MKKLLCLFTFCLLLLASCEDDAESGTSEEQILAYLEANELEAERSESGLYYIIEEEGSGARPSSTSTVTVSYKGFLTDGTVFDQNSNATLSLAGVIPGWTEGIQLFRAGGNGVLLVPSQLGYGSSGIRGVIPGNAALVFEVAVLEVFE